MARATNGIVRKKRVKKILSRAKGYYGAKSKQFRTAKTAVMRSLVYAYRDRRQRKRMMRRLWTIRINAAVREHGMSYSKFVNALSKAGIELNRKMLAALAVHEPKAFKAVVEEAKKALA